MVESMFDPRVRGVAARPIPVLVDPHAAWQTRGIAGRKPVPLWLRAKGFRIDPPIPGEALEWIRLDTGEYLIRVRFRLESAGTGLDIVAWLTRAGVVPRPAHWRPPLNWIEAREERSRGDR